MAFSNDNDECHGRQGVAIANEAAIVGRGSGKACTTVGSPVCYQAVTSSLAWIDTPAKGRLAFSKGNGGTSGLEADQDYGYCTLFDKDGSLYGESPTAKLYKADVAQEWPHGLCQRILFRLISYF